MKKSIVIAIIVLSVFGLTSCGDPKQKPKEEPTDAKPVIYLYPKEELRVNVELEYDGDLTCTYPKYYEGWNIKAYPDGKIVNSYDEKEYSYLFWEGRNDYDWDITKGFVVKGEDTIEFLQDKLSYMGLSAKEYNEFIVYWLPRMQDNKYNLIYFAEEEYEKIAKLSVNPKPDSILRIFMVYKALDSPVNVEKQELESFEREGFTVVEWGGKEIK